MALNNNDIAEEIFEALRDSADLLKACDDLFGTTYTVCLGLSGEDGPPPDECPVFEVISWNKERGMAPDNWPFAVSVNVYIRDDTRTYETTTDGVKTIVNQGPESLETLMDLAEAAIRSALPSLDIPDLSVDYDSITFFPLFAGALNMTFSFPKLLGGYEPTL